MFAVIVRGGANGRRVTGDRLRVAIYDTSGRLVRVLHDGMVRDGDITLAWDGRDAAGWTAPPGVYLARASMNGASASAKLVRP